jgi:hypothetical protein
MRTLATISLDTAAANAAIKNGELPKVLASTLERIKPEAAYFGVKDGKRTAYLVFDLKSPADIPPIAEPWFAAMEASVEFQPIMTGDDVRAGLEAFARG